MEKPISFVNLHLHTNFSMLDGLQSVEDLFDLVNLKGQKALAITDHGTLAAFFDAYKSYKRTGVKFIPGCENYFVHTYDFINEEGSRRKTEKRKHIVLLAQNEIGFKNLLRINYEGFKNFVMSMGRVFPRISWDILEQYNEGIIITSACGNGILGEQIFKDDYEKALEYAKKLSNIFKNRFYLEIQPHALEDDKFNQINLNNQLIKISKELNIPLVVATDAHYLTKSDAEVHDILMAINSKKPVDDPNRHRYGIDEFYVKDGEEVYDFLAKHHGKEIAKEAISNTVKIADSCEAPDYMEPKGNHLPFFNPKNEEDYEKFKEWLKKTNMPSNLTEDKAYMRYKVIEGFKNKFSHLNKDERKKRWERVKSELEVLEGNNFSSYMLITSDMIKWAKENNILTSPGRGSSGGSLIAYLLRIHEVDPFDYGLLFERFQNAYKKDLPDIDTDFTSSGRDKVKEYVINKYGRDNCAQVSNINTYTPKNVIPNLVKSMRNVMPGLIPEGTHYVQVSNAIKEVIPDQDPDGNKVKTLERAKELSPKLREFANRCPELMEYADKIIGLPAAFSTHAAGMVVSDVPIYEFAPLRLDKNGDIAVQYEKNRCEAIGLVKMDFLAISTLDIIDETFKNIRSLGLKNAPSKMEDIPLDDKETYEMIQKGNTKCVFQLGKSTIMVSLCKKIRPKNISDIAVINALGRPSSSGDEREEFIERSFGRRKISYIHPSLENSLKDTYGLGIFEEQLMVAAQDVAGWDLNKADGLRKLTKMKGKNPEMALQLEVDFLEGAVKKHNMPYEDAQNIWDNLILPFAKYGFNRSHAVFYSISGYYTAYLKRHYPAAFLAACLKVKTSRGGLNREEDINNAKVECRRMGVNIIAPDINKSKAGYEILDENNIVMGLAAVKGMGEKALEEITNKQPFMSFIDFIYRVDARIVNKSKIEALSKAGCFDSFNINRKDIHDEGKKIRDKFNNFIRKKVKDGYDVEMIIEDFPIKFSGNEWSLQEKLRHEQEVLGELVTGSIDDLFPHFFTEKSISLSKLKILPNRHRIFVEVILKSFLREFKIKTGKYKGQKMAKYLVADKNGVEVELTVWPSEYEEVSRRVIIGHPIKAICEVSDFNGSKTLMLKELNKVYSK